MSVVKQDEPRQNVNVSMEKRDGETYIALGIFIIALGLPVLLGTYWAYQPKGPGSVLDHTPSAHAEVQPGDTVDLVISLGAADNSTESDAEILRKTAPPKGSEPVARLESASGEDAEAPFRLPNLVGMSRANAERSLQERGLELGAVTGRHSTPYVRGAVVNLICGITLLAVGMSSIGYGIVLLMRHQGREVKFNYST